MKNLPQIKMTLQSSPIIANAPVTKEFRKSIRRIVKFWQDNKNRKSDGFRVCYETQKQLIELSNNLKVLRRLKGKWCVELDQELKSYHSISAEEELKRILGEESKKDFDKAMKRQVLKFLKSNKACKN